MRVERKKRGKVMQSEKRAKRQQSKFRRCTEVTVYERMQGTQRRMWYSQQRMLSHRQLSNETKRMWMQLKTRYQNSMWLKTTKFSKTTQFLKTTKFLKMNQKSKANWLQLLLN